MTMIFFLKLFPYPKMPDEALFLVSFTVNMYLSKQLQK